jgi:prophage regulatory protein
MKLLKKKAVCELVSYSPAHIDRLERAGTFPKRVTLGQQRVAWVESEILDWIAQRIAERDSQ